MYLKINVFKYICFAFYALSLNIGIIYLLSSGIIYLLSSENITLLFSFSQIKHSMDAA